MVRRGLELAYRVRSPQHIHATENLTSFWTVCPLARYQFKYGLPLGKAAKTGSVYTRSFTGCDVTVNCTGVGRSNCKGTIEMKEHSH